MPSWTLEKTGKKRVCVISGSWGDEHKGRSYAMHHLSCIHERRGPVLVGAGIALSQIEWTGCSRFSCFCSVTFPFCTKERTWREKILPQFTSCVGFGFFLPPSSPSVIKEKQQLEVHPSAWISPSNPMAQLSPALASTGHGSTSTQP